jgi:hypothetical protein
MKKEEWNEGLNHLDPDLVEKYVEQKDRLRQKSINPKVKWLRFGAIAACFLLIVSAAIVVSMPQEDPPAIEPYFPNGEAWSPVINSHVRDIILTADQVGSIFDQSKDSVGTNQYTKIYTTNPEYLNLTPLPIAEYLPIYSSNNGEPSEEGLQTFIHEYLDATTSFFGISSKNYEIEKHELWNGNVYCTADIREGEKDISFYSRNNLLYFTYFDLDERRLLINGSRVSILESDTDQQITEKLEDTVTYVCTAFGKQYTDIKICRNYYSDQLTRITVYLYSAEETIFPTNFSQAPMTSDYLSLTFHTDWGRGTACDWGGSKEEAFLTNISLYQTSEKWIGYYEVDAKAKMLTLEEAEQLLEKGYVFGGHSCSLCMAAQPEVDFSEYTYVDIEYVSDKNGTICVPFYAFYKYIGKSEHGIDTYAKTYVPAVQVSGYDAYFEKQKDNHRIYN